MVWSSEFINDEGKNAKGYIGEYMSRQPNKRSCPDAFKISIVGGGPKGLYALDTLFNEIRENIPQKNIHIYWWNDSDSFACGPNYCTTQPEYLLINYCIGNIDAWDRDISTEQDRLNLLEWVRKYNMTQITPQPTDFASRALVGCYLQSVAKNVLELKPHNVQLTLVPETVNNIQAVHGGKLSLYSKAGKVSVNNVLLTTGHCYENNPIVTNKLKESLSSKYIRKAYPITQIDAVLSRVKVGVVGWGLTFIDVALHLTEGRGGKFDENMNYHRSGNEPVLIPFSRSNLPVLPRGPIYGDQRYKLHYLNESWIQKMDYAQSDRKIDFVNEILPMIEKEVQYAYYSTLLGSSDESAIGEYIQSIAENERFTLHRFLFTRFSTKSKAIETTLEYLESLIAEAELGELNSPLMAASAVWREISPVIARWYAQGGYTGRSQQILDEKYFGAFCRVSYGPPVLNMKKIVSLIKAGTIKVIFTDPVNVTYQEQKDGFLLTSSNICIDVEYMIDARIARPDLSSKNSHFYEMLSDNNLLEPMNNEGYKPGCMRLDSSGESLVGGEAVHLYSYGTNTEGALLDNDSLSRIKNNLAKPWAERVLKMIQEKEAGIRAKL